jgi:hypothetical protein
VVGHWLSWSRADGDGEQEKQAMKLDPRVARFVFAAAAVGSLLMGASGYLAVSSLIQEHQTTSRIQEPASSVHHAQLMPYQAPLQFPAAKGAGSTSSR